MDLKTHFRPPSSLWVCGISNQIIFLSFESFLKTFAISASWIRSRWTTPIPFTPFFLPYFAFKLSSYKGIKSQTPIVCNLLSSLPTLSTLNFISGARPGPLRYIYNSCPQCWDPPTPYDCPAVTDEIAVALPPSLRALNIQGLHRISPPHIAALRARGVQDFMASETAEAHRFFWAHERGLVGCSSVSVEIKANRPVNLEDLPRTDAEILRWMEARAAEVDDDGNDEVQ
ncbi:hypothetical protein BDK51DRAFT_36690 [Blyttiomyces helicus]|uniref:Uncharacterized protein n=1 Tax=Blyttiomyces helicus TaxID=388810 RepID=A0A4P9WJL9_9FUNG|nr:hypothetical protein BDK51DRAFT_36690 [Blyttiomyces helicus]|eukprot:RKO90836.1 hypothetical protein BDK51DRAFT_36690 [Blyttiomyces helicus]